MSASLPFGKSTPPLDIVRSNGLLPGIEAEATMGPAEQLAGSLLTDQLFPPQSRDESLTKLFGKRLDAVDREQVEAALAIHEARSSEDMEVGMEPEIIAKSLHRSNGGELAVG